MVSHSRDFNQLANEFDFVFNHANGINGHPKIMVNSLNARIRKGLEHVRLSATTLLARIQFSDGMCETIEKEEELKRKQKRPIY